MMPPVLRNWRAVGLLLLEAAKGSLGSKNHHEHVAVDETTVVSTVFSTTTVPVTCYVNVTVPHYVDITIPNYVNTTLINTVTKIVSAYITESTTATLRYTTAVTDTETDSTSTTRTLHFTESTTATLNFTTSVTETETDSTSITETLFYTVSTTETDSTSTTETLHYTVSTTETETDTATITNTETDTDTVTTTSTVPATITTYTTKTVFSTTYDPCPKSCSISAETVNLYFWPTNRPYTYPSTHVDKKLGYTFVSPSVYMMIPTAVGINTAGQRAGPSTSSWILALDLEEVSTIDGTATKQLTLSHLGTDCPKTADPTAIATMVDPACNPVLAAPRQVRSWAYPCNACGRFGLFDPPYAVPPVTGLIATTTAAPVVVSTLTVPAVPTPAVPTLPVGVVEVVYFVNGQPVSTATLTSTGIAGTMTSSVFVATSEAPSLPVVTSSTDAPSLPTVTSSIDTEPEPSVTSAPGTSLPSFSEPISPTSAPATAAAAGLRRDMLGLALAVMGAVLLL